MRGRARLRLALLALTLLVVASVFSAFTAANTVPATNAGVTQQAITADTLKPSICSGIALTAIDLPGAPAPGAASELVLGNAAANNIGAAGGNDCVLGGGGNDTLSGQGGNDVLIGGPGTDTCNGNAGADVFDPSCETQNP